MQTWRTWRFAPHWGFKRLARVIPHCRKGDYDFHLAIARAAHNPQILDFLTYLSATLVPRLQLGYVLADDVKEGYFARIHEEHAAIVAPIEEQSGDLARRMMRQHLTNSLARLRALELSAGKSLLANTAP